MVQLRRVLAAHHRGGVLGLTALLDIGTQPGRLGAMSLSIGDSVTLPDGTTGQVWSPSLAGWWVATGSRFVEVTMAGEPVGYEVR